jgi:phosphate-selective porin OprO/OprP
MSRKPWFLVAAVLACGAVVGPTGAAIAASVNERLEETEERLRMLQDEVQELRKEAAAKPVAAPEDPKTFRVFWKEGLRFETKDKKFTSKIGGRIQNDYSWGTQDSDVQDVVGDFKNGTEFRRARVYIEGSIYDDFIYKAQYDFAGGDSAFKDVYLGMRNIPYAGTFKVGQYKEPFSLEELTSSNYITFMERSLPNALVPARSTGLSFQNTLLDERVNWAIGTFRKTDDFGDNAGDGELVVSGRVAALPIYQDEGRTLWEVGVSSRYYRPGEDQLGFDSRPENHLADRYIDTGDFAVNNSFNQGVETALVLGPASLQSEWVYTGTDTPGSADPNFWGMYVFGSYFLTGESRPYKLEEAAFTAVQPKRNFSFTGDGWGAWELAARYSMLDLSSAGIDGGTLRDVTTGVNWYPNSNFRVMFNWVHAELQSTGSADLFATRFQVFF